MSKKIYAILPNVIVPLAGMSTDIYLPSMPSMVDVFHVSQSLVQLSLSSFVLGMGVAQLLAGPLSDSLGRKQMILAALIIQMLAVLCIINTTSMTVLIAIRLLQGLGGGFMIVPARAILNDSFSGLELRKKFNYLTISFALAPILAPFIGGYCEKYFGYQASFVFIFLYALGLFLTVALGISETLKQKKTLSIKEMGLNYKTILGHRNYLLGTLFVCALFGYTSLFSAIGPFMYQDKFNFSPVEYGYIALLIGLAWFLGNVSNRLLLSIADRKKIIVCLCIQLGLLLVFLLIACWGFYTALLTTTFVFLMVFLTGLIFPNMVAECLTLFPEISATANACFFSFLWLAFSAYTVCATALSLKTLLPFVISLLAIHLLSWVVYMQFSHTENTL